KSLGVSYFNISEYLALSEADDFLFWFELEDGIGNSLVTHKTKGIFDNNMAQNPPSENLFSWSIGTNSTGSGIILFGSDSYLDSTIQINVSSVVPTVLDESDVHKIYIYGSNNSQSWDYLGRAYYSGDSELWNLYWNFDLITSMPADNYNLKTIIFDRAGNYLAQTHAVKIFNYVQVQLVTDLVFGEIFEYNYSSISNVQTIDGVIENYLQGTSTNVWDLIAEFYSPLENAWIPLSTDSATILSNGSYSVTWDISRDYDFLNSMYDIQYDYLPFQVISPDTNDLWGSWGVFNNSGVWQPIIVSKSGADLDISIYKFNNISGWQLDNSLSAEESISSINNQVFKLHDIHNDGKWEILRVSSAQIDVIALDSSNTWVITENITALSDYEYFSFDIGYNNNPSNTILAVSQKDSLGDLSLWTYTFDSNYLLSKITEADCPTNFVPSSIKIENYYSSSDRKAILVSGLIDNTYYSQLIEFDFNLNIENIVVDAILGNIAIIEYNELNGVDTIILGIERGTIGKMDSVITLRQSEGEEEWVEFEISNFDDTKFEILDLITISDNNIDKLITASKTGLFETKIIHYEDSLPISSPICNYFEVFTKQELTPVNYPEVFMQKTPVYSVSKVSFKLTGSNQWVNLSPLLYSCSTYSVKLDLSSIWASMTYIKIAYNFKSFVAEERTSIDPSFDKYSGTPDTQSVSASGTFFDASKLPFLWLNPTTTTTLNPNWQSLPNGMTYQHLPVISGLGNKVAYPSITSGWDYGWGSEYINMPELSNSLISYGDDYDSGQLDQYLSSVDNKDSESRFQNNYIDSTYISNPYISENFNFSSMYNAEIHDSSNSNGLYNYYDGSQNVLVKNELKSVDFFNTSTSQIFNYGNFPDGVGAESFEFEELNSVLLNWSQYLAINTSNNGKFGADFVYQLPAVSRDGIKALYLSFDAAFVANSFTDYYPLSIQLWNYELSRWESIPLAPLSGSTYESNELVQDFWRWNPDNNSYTFDEFRPSWGSEDENNINI
ncbi:MAG: hypothetical protein ACW99Q_19115, partial [Candidatus Kariarchaeaceae archaeon]